MIQKYNNGRQAGFTIVELMIAMGFIAFLLLAIAATVIQIGAIYNKGITMKSVNQAGRFVVTDMKRIISESQPFATADAYKPHNRGTTINPDFDGGRLCTGTYSYVWNIGTYIDQNNPATWVNKYAGSDSNKPLRFIKVRDSGGQYCKDGALGPIQLLDATELLAQESLAVQAFHIDRLTNNLAGGMALYSIGITISNADNAAIDTVDNTCKAPAQDSTFQNFCAVNEFSFTARAGNKGGQ